jgi:hypothetical protein
MAQEECDIQDHRIVVAGDCLALEYRIDGRWCGHAQMDVASVRAYELRLLRSKPTKDTDTGDTDTCNRDTRKGSCETACGRKSNGILAAVTPCLQIAAVRPMYAAESLTQVLHLVWHLMQLFPDMEFVLYDNACAIVRHLRKQIETRSFVGDTLAAWKRLALLKYVIDRLHWTYHRACRDPSSGWYVRGVDPALHPSLLGVDTEGAEQIFHIANRWQDVLSNSAPLHQELFLLVFAREHNKGHGCRPAIIKYEAARRVQAPLRAEAAFCANPEEGECCLESVQSKKRKKKKEVHAPEGCAALAGADAPVVVAAGRAAQSAVSGEMVLYSVVNERSNTMHAVTLPDSVYSECSWSFQGRALPVQQQTLRGKGYWQCGVCYGVRQLFA